jgi:hypothetical protein
MEVEKVKRKKAVKREIVAVRTEPNPFYLDDDGVYRFDARLLSAPEFQPVIRALYEYYEFGGTFRMPSEIFPIRQLPEDRFLVQLAGRDTETFINLLRSDPVIRARLLPQVPFFIKEAYPDAMLLLEVATDEFLLGELQQLNTISRRVRVVTIVEAVRLGLTGFSPGSQIKVGRVRYNRSDMRRMVDAAISGKDIPMLNAIFRVGDGANWETYFRIQEAAQNSYPLRARLYGEANENFMLGGANECTYSKFSAIKLCITTMRIGEEIGSLRWRFRGSDEWNAGGLLSWLAGLWQKEATMLLDEESEEMREWHLIARLTEDFVAALTGVTVADSVYEFDGIVLTNGDEHYEHAALLVQLMKEYKHGSAEALRRTGKSDPLVIDFIGVDLLRERICRRMELDEKACNRWWMSLLREIYTETLKELRVQTRDYSEEESGNSTSSTDAYPRSGIGSVFCCSCRSALGTRRDSKFGLPFCATTECMTKVFRQFHAYGLWSPSSPNNMTERK